MDVDCNAVPGQIGECSLILAVDSMRGMAAERTGDRISSGGQAQHNGFDHGGDAIHRDRFQTGQKCGR